MGTGERWSKAVFFGIGWFILFVILQCVYMVYAFGLKVSLDPSYLLQVAQIFDGADLTDTEQYTETVTNLVYSLTTYLEVLLATGMVGLYIIDRQFHSTRFGIHAIKVWDIPQFVFIGIIINLLSTLFVSCFSQETLEETGYDTDSLMQGSFGGTLLAVGICAPICEEIAFRYFIYHNLARGNKIVAVIISAGLFGVAHGNLLQGMYAFAFGLIFAFADEDYNSLIPSIIMHMTVNSLSCLTLLCADDLEVMVLYGCALLLSLILTIIAYILKYIGTKRCVVAEIYNINYNTYEIMKKVTNLQYNYCNTSNITQTNTEQINVEYGKE